MKKHTLLIWLILIPTALALPACGLRSPSLLEYPQNPELLQAATRFYDYLKLKQLDGFFDQPGIRDLFPNRETYYDFLDTVLPPMRERRFEQYRITDYAIREIAPNDKGASLKITFLSDDILPFGKLVTVEQQWIRVPEGWFPGKLQAPKATFWDKIR